jgi:hypothetical protein
MIGPMTSLGTSPITDDQSGEQINESRYREMAEPAGR